MLVPVCGVEIAVTQSRHSVPPPEGLTRHYEVSPSQHMAAETGGWRRTASRSVVLGNVLAKHVLELRVLALVTISLPPSSAHRGAGLCSVMFWPNTYSN
eukprot:scaffold77012_cov32-Phaeocystis_antarctica.AAC.1